MFRSWPDFQRAGVVPEDVFLIDQELNESYFRYMSSVVHDGRTNITSAVLAAGKPAVVVPCSGDQFFWGNVIGDAGAGPYPLLPRKRTARRLADAIMSALDSDYQTTAAVISAKSKDENGVLAATEAFHASLPLNAMTCSLDPCRAAAWRLRKCDQDWNLSAFAATALEKKQMVHFEDLERYGDTETLRHCSSIH